MSEKPATTKKTNPNIKLTKQAAELEKFVEQYKANNDKFEASINDRHARWDAVGIGQPLPRKRGTMAR
jgi:hypothetical protein